VGRKEVDWIELGTGPVADCCERGIEPSVSIILGNFFTSWVAVNFSRKSLLKRIRKVYLGTSTGYVYHSYADILQRSAGI